MSHPRRMPRCEPEPELLALFEQPDRIPVAVRRQGEFFVFFAQTIFPLLETYRERLAPLYCADNGRPAWDPVRLLAVLVLQFVLRVTDRQAAEAVQYDQRWRLALHMDPREAAFDPSLLVVFRGRLVNGKTEALAFKAVLDYLVEQGWVPKRSRQRLDSTHVRGLLSAMNRLDCARETIRLFLEDVEADGALPEAWSAYWDLYVEVSEEQQAMGLDAPSTLYVDGAYVSSEALKEASEQGRELRGPAPASPDRGKVFTVEKFDVHVEERYAVCPAAQRSSNCSRLEEQSTGKVVFRIEWSNAVCGACPLRPQCVNAGQDHRTFVVGELHSLLQERRREMQTDAFKREMHRRNGIEGTQSELVRGYGLRQARYRGKDNVRLQNYLIDAACNIQRLFRRLAWEANQAHRAASVAMIPVRG